MQANIRYTTLRASTFGSLFFFFLLHYGPYNYAIHARTPCRRRWANMIFFMAAFTIDGRHVRVCMCTNTSSINAYLAVIIPICISHGYKAMRIDVLVQYTILTFFFTFIRKLIFFLPLTFSCWLLFFISFCL